MIKITLLTIAMFVPVISQTDVNELTPTEEKIGWTQLFDGTQESVSAFWTTYVQDDPNTDQLPGNLLVRDAEEGAWFGQETSGGSDIRTKEKYTNFDIRFQYMVSGNSGFFYRGELLTSQMFQNTIELAILNNLNQINSYRTNLSGSIYDVYVPFEDNYKVFNTGEWNEVRVVAKGDSVYHYHNGALYGYFDGNSDEFKDIIRGDIPVPGTNHISKWTSTNCFTVVADNTSECSHDNPYRQTGYFGMQLSYGGEQRYRGFKILDLTSGCMDPDYEEYSPDFMENDQSRCLTSTIGVQKNPAMDKIKISIDATLRQITVISRLSRDFQLDIISLNGTVLAAAAQEGNIHRGVDGGARTVSTAGLSGLYFVRVSADNFSITKKIIVP